MPLARGLMQIGRLSYFPTATSFTVSEAPPYSCGETIHVNVTVSNTEFGTPVPTGTVQLFDVHSSTVLGSGTLSGGSITIVISLNSSIVLQANYLGTTSSPFFHSSSSSTSTLRVSLINTATAMIEPAPNSTTIFCFDTIFEPVVAQVTSTSGTPSGSVRFDLYTDNTNFTTFSTVPLSGGFASTDIPKDYTTPGLDGPNYYWISAVYLGGGCFQASSAPTGTAGPRVGSFNQDITNITNPNVTLHGGGSLPATFCYTTPLDISVTVTATLLPPPSIGTVIIFGSQSTGVYTTPVNLISGTPNSGQITFSSFQFPAAGNGQWFLQAVYTDGTCYQTVSSQSGTRGTVISTVFDDNSSISATTTTFVAPNPSNDTTVVGEGFTLIMKTTAPGIGAFQLNGGTLSLYYAFSSTNVPPANYPSGWTLFSTASPSGDTSVITIPDGSPLVANTGTLFFVAIYAGAPCYGDSHTNFAGTEATQLIVQPCDGAATSIAFTAPSSGTQIGLSVPLTIQVQVTSSRFVNDGSVELQYAFSHTNTTPSNFPSGAWQVAAGPSGPPSSGFVSFNLPASFFNNTGTYWFIAFYSDSPRSCFASSNTTFIAANAFNIIVSS